MTREKKRGRIPKNVFLDLFLFLNLLLYFRRQFDLNPQIFTFPFQFEAFSKSKFTTFRQLNKSDRKFNAD